MPLTLDDLDSPIIQDKQNSFVGGQVSNALPLQIDQDSCSLVEDCEPTIHGGAISRRGTTYLGDSVQGRLPTGSSIRGLGFYNSPLATFVLAAAGDFSYKLSGGTTWEDLDISTLWTDDEPITFLEWNSNLYAANANNPIRKYSGSNWVALSTDHPPQNAKCLIEHHDRLVVANASVWDGAAYTASPDSVLFSGILDDGVWTGLLGGYQIQPGTGDGQAVVSIVSWQNFNIAVFKDTSIWLIGADPLLDVSDMPVTRVHDRVGCKARLTTAQVGSDILFLANDGVRSLQQTMASDSRYELGQPLSSPVQDVIDRITPSAKSGACATFWKGLYLLAIPVDGSLVNNYILVWNSVTEKWSGGWTNLPISCFATRNDNGIDKLIMGLSNDNIVIELLDYVPESDATDATYTDYNGNYVVPHFKTRGMIFGDLYSPKKGLHANITLFNSKGPIEISAIFDEGRLIVTKTIDTGDPLGFPIPFTLPIRFPRKGIQPASFGLLPYPKFNQLQFEVKGTGPGRKEIRQINVSAFPEAIDLRGKFDAQ